MVKIFRILKGSLLSRSKDFEFSLSPSSKNLDLNFLQFLFFVFANLQQYFRVQKLFLIDPLKENKCSSQEYASNFYRKRNYRENGFENMELSRKWSRKMKNPSCAESSRKWSRLFMYKGIFYFAMIPYLLEAAQSTSSAVLVQHPRLQRRNMIKECCTRSTQIRAWPIGGTCLLLLL